MLIHNWNEWKRMQINIEKAKCNKQVSELLTEHYTFLHSMLVKYEADEDVFNDAYLKLTYKYNPNEDFIDQYCYFFNLLKGAYYCDSKVTKWLEVPLDNMEIADTLDELETIDKNDFLIHLKNAITEQNSKSKKQNL